MNGVHDLGGMQGFGPIDPEPEDQEPIFHAEWEGRVFALVLACGALGRWSIDASRHSRERLDPVTYLRTSYYEKWFLGLQTVLVENGILTGEEVANGKSSGPAPAELTDRKLSPERVGPVLAGGSRYDMKPTTTPLFQPGDRVRVRAIATTGHTRAVRYAQGRFGTIEAHRGCHVFPDLGAQGEKLGRHLYGVGFRADELWGEAGSPRDTVHIDLWEPYLEAAP